MIIVENVSREFVKSKRKLQPNRVIQTYNETQPVNSAITLPPNSAEVLPDNSAEFLPDKTAEKRFFHSEEVQVRNSSSASQTCQGASQPCQAGEQPFQAIRNLSFHIPKGEIVGIIGSNGAGKSTLLKMIVGVLSPSSGTIRTASMDPVTKQKKLAKKIGIIFGTSSNLLEDTTVEESLLLTGKMYHLAKNVYEDRYQELEEVLGIHEFVSKKRENLSLGEERRASLAMCLIHDPELLILDEAMIGMDAVWRQKTMDYLKRMNQKSQMTIVITSHNIADVRSICSRVLILKNGRSQYYGSIDYLERNYANEGKITLTLLDKIPDMEDLTLVSYYLTNQQMIITYNRRIISAKTILHHILQQCTVNDIKVSNQDLEVALLNMQKEDERSGK